MCYLDFGRFINLGMYKCIINVVISPTFLATLILEALQFNRTETNRNNSISFQNLSTLHLNSLVGLVASLAHQLIVPEKSRAPQDSSQSCLNVNRFTGVERHCFLPVVAMPPDFSISDSCSNTSLKTHIIAELL